MLLPENWMLNNPQEDPVFQTEILPWLNAQGDALKAYDAQRPADTWYIFHTHVQRVASMGYKFALYCGAPEHAARWYEAALLIHDCGKMQLPVTLWDSIEKPSDEVKKQRRQHAPLGAQMIEGALPRDHPFMKFAADIARYHHEQMDGGGTLGVKADTLSPWIRAACIIDSFDGMSVPRPHFGNRDLSPAAVYERLSIEKGARIYDGEVVAAFRGFLKV